MTQTREGVDAPAALERAEQVMSRAGYQLGILAGRATLRVQQATQALRAEKEHTNKAVEPQRARTEIAANGQANQPATVRAEDLVDRLGQRVGHWAKVNGLQARKVIARLQEEVEDMWVEAHERRNDWREKREQE